MRTQAVDSSYLQSLKYDEVTKVVCVRFTDGAVIEYSQVSPRTYQAVMSADSVGEKFIELIRDSHKFKVIREAQ
jgi:KTSC domain-containing protein